LTTINGKPGRSDPIIIQIQTRGVGKTKAIYDLAMKQDVIYFDFTCDRMGKGAKYEYISRCYRLVDQLVDRTKCKSYEDYRKLRSHASRILEKLFLAGMFFHGIFRKTFPKVSPEFFFRFAMNGGSKMIHRIFEMILGYDVSYTGKL
jgi:hypothetical protein